MLLEEAEDAGSSWKTQPSWGTNICADSRQCSVFACVQLAEVVLLILCSLERGGVFFCLFFGMSLA